MREREREREREKEKRERARERERSRFVHMHTERSRSNRLCGTTDHTETIDSRGQLFKESLSRQPVKNMRTALSNLLFFVGIMYQCKISPF